MDKIKVLFAGESWFFTTIETKGFDQFTIGGYETVTLFSAYLLP